MWRASRSPSKVRAVVGATTVTLGAVGVSHIVNGAPLGGIASTNVFYKFSISNNPANSIV